ncbi:MAG: phosphohistidine phosphatase SixA [Lentisphaerae bacterium RIFOXYC12_FULL_60_16]|nr:MAG: phosphohistidine phosphatase SixA [Lentisphaerae bacterium RIFOXYC12_FULL_60_16]OGV72984.1 MAG: phosphohistidine phosphatase SixA [Lentisphaerae bacterium RIFOXYA12_FULL_60_10]OGV76808.1 MAG: phosphohistidine phosphatase SixA [Lentisphaerae bacterium RIFOXYB12_FULL_60_10]
MNVFLARHGIAEDMAADGGGDADRRLTHEGRMRTREVAAGLRAAKIHPERIFSSPLIRAVETAGIFHEGLHVKEPVEVVEALAPGGHPADVAREIERSGAGSVMLVGHMPDLSMLAGWMTGRSGGSAFAFKKASVLCLETDAVRKPGHGCVTAFLTPAVLRQLGA